MAAQRNKIFINTTFDVHILKAVVKKNWYWCVLVTSLFITLAFLYLRYTKPIYKSSILIQISDEDQGAEVLGFQGFQKDNTIAKELELLRSRMLFSKAIEKLPLKILSYAKGDILTELHYKQGSFYIQLIEVKNPVIYNVPIYLEYIKDEGVILNYTCEGKDYQIPYTEDTIHSDYFSIKMKVEDVINFEEECQSNQLYFQINKPEDIANLFYDGLSVEVIDYSAQTIEISYQGNNSILAYDIVTTLTDEFFNYDETVKKESNERILKFIDAQLDSLSKSLNESKNQIINYQRTEGVSDPTILSSALNEKIIELKEKERLIIDELRVLNKIDQKIQGNPESIEIYRLLPDLIGKSYSTTLGEQINELYTLAESREDLLYKVTTDNEVVKRVNKKIAIRKDNIREFISNLIKGENEQLKFVNSELSQIQGQFNYLPEKELELSKLINIKDLNEKYFSLFTEKQVMYSISNAGYTTNNKVLNPAINSSQSIFPKKAIVYGIALFFSFSISLSFLLLRYLTYNKINQLFDLQNLAPFNTHILGIIPKIKLPEKYSRLVVENSSRTAVSEYFRLLRTNLTFINKDAKTIAITSTVSGEGKTFVALNIGGVYALTGKRVILIDLDMRKPKVHLGLDKSNTIGMSNILAKHCTIEEAIQNTGMNNFDFIPAGPIPPNPAELIMNPIFDEILENLKLKYDIIIIDNPPVGVVADGLQVMSKSDIPIYIFRAEYSKRVFIEKLEELSKLNDIKNLNVILNGVSLTKSSYYKNNYYTE
ncbi:MAG: polysaccharide biosynthesis tyrosine autokinase [Brumimicrobium sp.]|nr:polysaccharide biosynthesis tyrosine autokinase [Brumimicrobium sp.]